MISPTAKQIVLSMEWQSDPEFENYRMRLTDPSGRSIWSEDQILSPSSDILAITLPTNIFQPGKYLLTSEGGKAGHYSIVGRYRFLVIISK